MKDFLQSPKIRPILWGLGALIILLLVFSLGTAVGYRRALFASRWGQHYYANFYGVPPGASFSAVPGIPGMIVKGVVNGPDGIMMRAPFNMHGVAGEVLDVATATISVRNPFGVEESVVVFPDTVIRGVNGTITLRDMNAGTWVAVIGAPNGNGQVGAKFIRVFLSSSSFPAAME